MAAVLIMRPGVVTGLAEDVAGLFVGTITDTAKPEPKKERKNPADRHRDATQIQ